MEEESWPSRQQAPWRARAAAARWRPAPAHAESTTPGRPISWVGVVDRLHRLRHRRRRVLPAPTLVALLGRGRRRGRWLPLARVRQDDERRLVLSRSRHRPTPAGMSAPAASSVSVGETAGSVQYEQQRSARADLELSARRAPAAHPLCAGVSRRRRQARRRAGDAAAGQGGAARHDHRARAVARARRVRAAGADRAGRGRGRLLAAQQAHDVRVLGARRVHPADRGLAVLRLATARLRGAGPALAPGQRAGLRRGPRAAARRGAADRDPARRREGGRAVVGLVGGEDRRRVAARHRPGRLRAARLAGGASTTCPSGPSRGNCSRPSRPTRSAWPTWSA